MKTQARVSDTKHLFTPGPSCSTVPIGVLHAGFTAGLEGTGDRKPISMGHTGLSGKCPQK